MFGPEIRLEKFWGEFCDKCPPRGEMAQFSSSKADPCTNPHRLSHRAWKSDVRRYLSESGKKETCISTKAFISRMWGAPPRGTISNKHIPFTEVLDIIKFAKFELPAAIHSATHALLAGIVRRYTLLIIIMPHTAGFFDYNRADNRKF
jgi:hypothetical protein